MNGTLMHSGGVTWDGFNDLKREADLWAAIVADGASRGRLDDYAISRYLDLRDMVRGVRLTADEAKIK